MEDESKKDSRSPDVPPIEPAGGQATAGNYEFPSEVDPIPDTRLYLPDHDDWEVHIKRDSERFYCYAKLPGEDWFHLILNGEIYVSRYHEKFCLRCALRLGFLTTDRLFWQHRVPKRPPRAL